MVELEDWDSIAMYDVFNEPDHNVVHSAFWNSNGGKQAFNDWANAIADETAGVSTHPRNMGVAGFGNMFGMNQEDFNLATGDTGFEILHRHYYGSNTDPYNFEAPEQWADEIGKPLMWGELARNDVYPIVRYDFAEQAIWNAGGQLITSMVASGTPGYPYYGGVSSDAPVPRPAFTGKGLEFNSVPITEATVGHKYEYAVETSGDAAVSFSSEASFLEFDEETMTVTGVPDTQGEYDVTITASDDVSTVEQSYTLSVIDSNELVSITATRTGDRTFALDFTTDMSIENVSEVKWNLGDGNTSKLRSPVHTYADGEYNIELTVIDDEGKSYNASKMLDVSSKDSGAYVPTAGAIGAGPLNPAVIAAILLYGIVIGLFGYVELKKRDRF